MNCFEKLEAGYSPNEGSDAIPRGGSNGGSNDGSDARPPGSLPGGSDSGANGGSEASTNEGSAVCPHCGYDARSKPEQAYFLAPGTMLCDRYAIGTTLGYGGFGTTYRVWDTLLNSAAAIKEFYPIGLVSRVPGDANVAVYSGERRQHFKLMLERFLVEAKYMAKFNGEPNIVNVFDFFEANNTAYIVMEYLNGLSLRQYLENNGGKLSTAAALDIMRPVISGLSKIHAQGILHRDVSPDNIIITADNQIKILDFGAARLGSESVADEARNIVIKIGYAPPEQYLSRSEQGPYTDVYAVGATLYRAVTGITPEESVDRAEIDNLTRPSRLGVDMPPNVERAIMKALALRADIRFQSMDALFAALYRNKRVDYPEVEAAKRRRRRAIATIGSCAAAIAAIAATALYFLWYMPETTLDAARLRPDSVVVWVADGGSGDGSDGDSSGGALAQAVEAAAEQFGRDYPQFAARVVRVPEDEYYTALKLALAFGEEGSTNGYPPPDMFYNARGEEEFAKWTARLDKLVRRLDAAEYYFLQDYARWYPQRRVMPLGFDANVVYANLAAAREEGVAAPAAVDSVSRFEAPSGFGSGVHGAARRYAATDVSHLAAILWMFGELTIDDGGAELGWDGMARLDALEIADAPIPLGSGEDGFDYGAGGTPGTPGTLGLSVSADPLALLESDRLVLFVGDTSQYRQVQNGLQGYYGVIPITRGGRMSGTFAGEFSVSGASARNRQDIAMLFLQYALHGNSQNLMSLQRQFALPLHKGTFGEFIGINGDLAFLEGSAEGMAMLYGQDKRSVSELLASQLVSRLLPSPGGG